MAMSRAVFAAYNNLVVVVVIAVVPMHKQCKQLQISQLSTRARWGAMRGRWTYEGDEKGDDVDDGKSKACLEHRTCLVDVQGPAIPSKVSRRSEDTQIDPERVGGEVTAVCIGDGSEHDNTSDQSANESQINKSDEDCIMSRSEVVE